jgi:hypothetical protein
LFQPALGKTLVERSLTVRTESFVTPDLKGTPWTESVEATVRSRFEAGERGTWRLTQEVSSVALKRNGEAVQNRLAELVTRFPLKLELAADGAFVRVLEPEAAEAAVRATFGPEEAESLLPFFSAQALEQQAKREWEAKYGGLFGRDLAVGQTFYALEALGLTSGKQLEYAVERRVLGKVVTAYGEALVLELRCLGVLEGAAKAEVRRLMTEQGVKALEPSVLCEGRQEVVGSPFVPVSTRMRLVAHPKALDGTSPVEIALERVAAVQRVD